jgi:hypothetical protein
VSTRTITALAPVLGTSVDWLLDGTSQAEGAGLPFVDWAQVGLFLDPLQMFSEGGRLGEACGRWPADCFVTRTPDDALNRISPAGSYIVVDRKDREIVDGRCYLGLLDGNVLFRRWASESDRAEPYSNDPS